MEKPNELPIVTLAEALGSKELEFQLERLRSSNSVEVRSGMRCLVALATEGKSKLDLDSQDLDASVNLATFYGLVYPVIRSIYNESNGQDDEIYFEASDTLFALQKLITPPNFSGTWHLFPGKS